MQALTCFRRYQIVIEDDSAFLPDLTFNIDLGALDLSTSESSRHSSILSPHSARTSLSSQPEGSDAMTGLIIPSPSGGAREIGGFQLPSDPASSTQRQQRLDRLLEDDGEGFDFDPGFSIDADGNLVAQPIAGDQGLPRPEMRVASEPRSGQSSRAVRAGTQRAQYDVSAKPVFK